MVVVKVSDDELRAALRVVDEAGLDVVVKEQYRVLRRWIIESGMGFPPRDWVPRG